MILHHRRTTIRLATFASTLAALAGASADAASKPTTSHSSPSRATSRAPAKPAVGLAAAFNGTTGYLTAPTAPALEPEHTNAFTAAFWVKLGSTSNNPLPFFWDKDSLYMCLMGDPTNAEYRHVGIEVQNQTLTGNADGGATEYWGSTALGVNTWHHVVGTFNGDTAQGLIYIDGRLEAMRTVFPWPAAPDNTVHVTSTQPLLLARRHTDLRYNLRGQMASFMFWTRALSPAEVAATYAGDPPLDMAVRYEFTAAHGKTVPDLSPSGAHAGTLVGGTALVPSGL